MYTFNVTVRFNAAFNDATSPHALDDNGIRTFYLMMFMSAGDDDSTVIGIAVGVVLAGLIIIVLVVIIVILLCRKRSDTCSSENINIDPLFITYLILLVKLGTWPHQNYSSPY